MKRAAAVSVRREASRSVAAARAGAFAAFVLEKILEIHRVFPRFLLRARSRLRSAGASGLDRLVPRRTLSAAILVLAAVDGCGGDEIPTSGGRGFGASAAAPRPDPAAGPTPPASDAPPAEAAPAREEPVVYRDEDFVESERNRDPFRSYITAFRAQAPEEIQRRVVMPTTAVEEMRLIAIVGGIARPKAMLVDAMGVGHVVERGVYIGRAKVIQAAGSVAMVLNWRVDRIRENEVVLTRQDPADPARPALTRVIPLHEELAQK